jgi:S1-C subfamily serine protease
MVAALLLPVVAPGAARAQATLSAFEADVDRIAKRARPCMVTVIAQRDVAARPGGPKRPHSRVGSGAAVSAREVLTTASVVLGASRVYVVTDNKLEVEARIVGLDPCAISRCSNRADSNCPRCPCPPIAARAAIG